MLCYVMLCYVMLCYVMLCYVISRQHLPQSFMTGLLKKTGRLQWGVGRGEKGGGGGYKWRGASVSDHVGDGTLPITNIIREEHLLN